ncbi:LOW QUALITY PROTEIN: hypothetical protein HID58_054959 [Brassica napus]|uniref:Uncharacterized protein n=1 Tax=Brassica napus TaxID=3708 RepID=A0ABQ8AJ41_BRANA|nr:LOW QUALITY PROTEIN: hypothetical protein HID58_054959 [Brassica napus]
MISSTLPPSFDLEPSPSMYFVYLSGVLAKKLHLIGLGQSLVVIDVVFLVAGLPLIVYIRLGFQDLLFGDLTSMLFFLPRGWLHSLLISFCLFLFLCSLVSLHLSSLITSLVALPFAIFVTPGLVVFFFVYVLCAWKVVYGLKLKLWFLGSWLPFSPHPGYLSSSHASLGVCGVSLLELWFLLFRVLLFFAGMSALYVLVWFVMCFLSLSWWLCFRSKLLMS